ncbi:Ig-like domain-containing protein [Blastopirellula sp. JC732]|uniref:Ig-like domain-containing protein n=1 Tax=Blastopirellula sediminis TaxID=2894196 RepID=A0A9X1SHE6_9BACT|nr:Ig-like domain-containing protein [Blastopirellula sediminis]MCC9606601.1 Ig-like domain-containing protein [Blastopirellula sediminis]MCC9630102.1 Ig-like domain-containing protein [Blastopirellula sediminis]
MNVEQFFSPQKLAPVAIIAASMILGCGGVSGPQLGTVSGTVTLNGKPLPDATVNFYHENDRPAHGKTDANGRYELQFTNTRMGAIVGENVVRITAATVEGEGVKPKKEILPAMYNTDSELRYDVKAGSNADANFDLKRSTGGG